jgi:hypothetical protein
MSPLRAKIEDFVLLVLVIFVFLFPLASGFFSSEEESVYLCQKVCAKKLFQYKEQSDRLVCFCDKGIPGDYKKVILWKQ